MKVLRKGFLASGWSSEETALLLAGLSALKGKGERLMAVVALLLCVGKKVLSYRGIAWCYAQRKSLVKVDCEVSAIESKVVNGVTDSPDLSKAVVFAVVPISSAS